ncbi:hypothetical protein Droror1_Dr00019586 [Drosera rotundifolia]
MTTLRKLYWRMLPLTILRWLHTGFLIALIFIMLRSHDTLTILGPELSLLPFKQVSFSLTRSRSCLYFVNKDIEQLLNFIGVKSLGPQIRNLKRGVEIAIATHERRNPNL